MELTKEVGVTLYTNLVRVRRLDEIMTKALVVAKISTFFHSQQGQEAVGVGACSFLRRDDYLFYGHRGHGISKTMPKGVPPRAILAEHYGKATGVCAGITGWHTADLGLGIMGISGTLGGDFVLAAGVGISARMKGKGQVVVCVQGDATYCRGTFHEAAIMAANWRLPIVWVIENNQYMTFTPICEYFPTDNMAAMGFGYGMPGVAVDGQDVFAVYEAVQDAVDRARKGEGPSLIECKTYRFRPHAEGLPDMRGTELRPRDEIDTWKKRDPIVVCREKLLKGGIVTEAELEKIDGEAREEMHEADRLASEDPAPSNAEAQLKRSLFADQAEAVLNARD